MGNNYCNDFFILGLRDQEFEARVKYWGLGTNGSSSLETILLFWHLYSIIHIKTSSVRLTFYDFYTRPSFKLNLRLRYQSSYL